MWHAPVILWSNTNPMKRFLILLGTILVLALSACSSATAAPTNSAADCVPFANGSGPFTYVAIGASDAVGIGTSCPIRQGYVPLLGQRMPAETRVVNLGVSGATVKVALGDEVSFAVAARPSIVTVWLAANDFRAMESGTLTLATYSQQLDQLLGDLQSETTAHVYVANLPDLTKLPYFIHGTAPMATIGQQTTQWNSAIASIVASHHDVLVDLFASDLASHPNYIWIDGFHPSVLGYQALANIFWAAMQAHGDPHS